MNSIYRFVTFVAVGFLLTQVSPAQAMLKTIQKTYNSIPYFFQSSLDKALSRGMSRDEFLLYDFEHYENNKKKIIDLINQGANVNTRGTDFNMLCEIDKKRTILMTAVKEGDRGMVKFLLEKGADAGLQDGQRFTALMEATIKGQKDIVEMLLPTMSKDGFDKTDKNGGTALMGAVINGHTKILQLLICAGADVNQRSLDNWTALLVVAGQNESAAVLVFLNAGAVIDESNRPNISEGNYGRIKHTIHKCIASEEAEKGQDALEMVTGPAVPYASIMEEYLMPPVQ